MNCIMCNKELHGQQSKFCGTVCKSKEQHSRYYNQYKKQISIYRKARNRGDHSLGTNGNIEKRIVKRDGRYDAKFNERFYSIKVNAIKRGKEFNLTKEYVVPMFRAPCHYCGDVTDSLNLDRLNNALGYVIGNVVPCCYRCNTIKNTMGVNEMVIHIKKIINRMEGKVYARSCTTKA